jgi:hypothetical protein
LTVVVSTGRSNTYVSAHVPGELARDVADVAEGHPGLDLREAQRVLWGDIMPLVPVVYLAVGDYLHPRIQAVRRADPALPMRLRGDPDDLGTAALAEFLAPSVIISADSVFTRFGLANSVADTWLPLAHRLLQAAGYEATLTQGRLWEGFGPRGVFLTGVSAFGGIGSDASSALVSIAFQAGAGGSHRRAVAWIMVAVGAGPDRSRWALEVQARWRFDEQAEHEPDHFGSGKTG